MTFNTLQRYWDMILRHSAFKFIYIRAELSCTKNTRRSILAKSIYLRSLLFNERIFIKVRVNAQKTPFATKYACLIDKF